MPSLRMLREEDCAQPHLIKEHDEIVNGVKVKVKRYSPGAAEGSMRVSKQLRTGRRSILMEDAD